AAGRSLCASKPQASWRPSCWCSTTFNNYVKCYGARLGPMPSTAKTEATGEPELDRLFRALGDRTRRALLARLAQHPARVTELAEPFEMSLPAVSRHIRVLERARLVVRRVDGRVHHVSL